MGSLERPLDGRLRPTDPSVTMRPNTRPLSAATGHHFSAGPRLALVVPASVRWAPPETLAYRARQKRRRLRVSRSRYRWSSVLPARVRRGPANAILLAERSRGVDPQWRCL